MTEVEFERRALALFDEALERSADDRAAFIAEATGGDAALARRVTALLAQADGSERVLQTGGAAGEMDDEAMPERAGPYRIVKLIGRGGMGSVFEGARDTGDFEHKVAIKVIRAAGLPASLVDRFHRERQILARLNHPNIARLLDGGALPDGSPYIVMDYIDGEPIADWVAARGLSLAGRLRLFNDVCSAVRYAHQSLVIHRDITPSNVLVTAEGAAKLIDFGIAQPNGAQGASETEKRAESHSYTPGYAAPERLTGEGATVLSDIFSLGRPLADLAGADAETPELAAIIGKATQADPDDRYLSVDALMDDIQRLREGRPVKAMRGGPHYVTRKFLHRHPLAVSAAALALAGLIGGLVLTLSLYQQAEAERVAANKRYNEVRELAKFMMFDLYDELVKVAGNTRATEMIADKSLSYLESLRSDPDAPVGVALETAAGYHRLADVLGNPLGPNLGERATATSMLHEAIVSLEDLYKRYPNNPDVMRRLAEATFSGATNAYVSEDDNEKARRLALRAVEIYSALTGRPDATVDDRRNLLRARLMAAVPLAWMGQSGENVEQLKKVRADAKALHDAYPDDVDVEQFLGSVNVELARGVIRARDAGQGDESGLPYWDEAVRVREAAWARNPEDMRPYRTLATILYERGAERRTQGDPQGALDDMDRAGRIVGELLERDPDDVGLERTAGGILEETAKTLAYAGRTEEAVALIPRVRAQSEGERDRFPDNAGIMREYAYSLTLYADIYDHAGMDKERCSTVADARAAWKRAADLQPLSELDLKSSSDSLRDLGRGCPE